MNPVAALIGAATVSEAYVVTQLVAQARRRTAVFYRSNPDTAGKLLIHRKACR
jgi:hypothetical protein